MRLRRVVSLLVLSVSLPYAGALSAQTAAPTQPGAQPGAARATAADGQLEYRIGPEDKLQIAVWNNEAMSRTVPVRPDGKISLPLLNDVQAAGLTPVQLRDALVKRLTDYMPTAEVSVIVLETKSTKVSVIGEVSKPQFIKTFPKVFKGTHVDLDEVRTARAQTITVDSPGINAYADGEYVCPLPVEVSAVPGALKILRLPATRLRN